MRDEVKEREAGLFNRKSWTQLLISLGFSEEDLVKWHHNFEKDSSEGHVVFLSALGMSDEEISEFRSQLMK